MNKLMQLFPQPIQEIPFNGVYLAHDLRQYAQRSGTAFVYSNFVVSIDGRIAIPQSSGKGLMFPQAIANDRDWRLYQELATQADIIITSGRYLRDWANGNAQEILQVDNPRFADLRNWRQNRGLPPQVDIAIVSRNLRFPIPDALTANGRNVVVFTIANSDPNGVKDIESHAAQVIVAGKDSVDGNTMIQHMTELGYQTIYSAAGPKILHLLLIDRVLNRLYLTYANRLLGGQPYASIVEGPLLDPTVNLKINTIYLDADGMDGLGQLFVSYNRT
jgi:riboflavin biosynthesis pyrimidine reductase